MQFFATHLSRRALLQGVSLSLAGASLDGMEAPPFGLEALLDGSGMARIPSGRFIMGSPDGTAGEGPEHSVRITQDFEMSKFEVTQAQWETVMIDPHTIDLLRPTPMGAKVGPRPSHFKGPSLPVDSVSWDDIQVFLARLNARDPSHTYRLPTEAEWEYAAKAGKERDQQSKVEAVAWYKSNSSGQTHSIGQKQPNAWGLHDMRGNVSEWVQDWYSPDYYAESAAADPQGPPTGSYRVFRGACWFDSAEYCRSTVRRFDFPISRFYNVGFRVVRRRA